MSSPAVVSAEMPDRSNSVSRIFGVLFSPKATFESIARRPTWALPLVLGILLALGVVGIFGHRGGWPSYFEKQTANNTRFQQMPADQQQRVMEAQLKYAPPFALVEVVIALVAGAVIIAAVMMGLFNGLAGAKIGFKNSLGVVTYGGVPGLISAILALLIVSFKDVTSIDLNNIVASNAGAFLPSTSPRWMISLLSSLDIFTFWTFILMAVGFAAAAPKKLSFGKALAYLIGAWLIWVVVKVGLTAAFS
jgi:Yip1 domain